MPRPHIVILSSHPPPGDGAAVCGGARGIRKHADIMRELEIDAAPLLADLDVDLAVVPGRDGALLLQARRVIDCSLRLVGVNFRRPGFLAAFDWHSL